MRLLTAIFILLQIVSIDLQAQFSIDDFFNEPFNRSYEEIKDSLSGKKIQEKETMGIKSIIFYDFYDPFSVSIGYMFKDNNMMGRMLANGKEDEESANKLFYKLKNLLIQKFGDKYTDNSMLGVTMLSWSGNEHCSVMLSIKGEGAAMMLMKKSRKK